MAKEITDQLDPGTLSNIRIWLEGDYDASSQAEVKQLLQTDPVKLSLHSLSPWIEDCGRSSGSYHY